MAQRLVLTVSEPFIRVGFIVRVMNRIIFGVVATACLVAQSVSAQPGVDLPVAVGKTTLTVAGSGYWHRDILEDGEAATLSAYDSSGSLLADGRYSYELISVPDKPASSRMQGGIASSDPQQSARSKQRPVSVKSGNFEILGGELIAR